jgi:large subunit ribosomal protein L25
MYGAVDKPVPLSVAQKELRVLLSGEGEIGLIEVLLQDDTGKKVAQEKAIIRQVDYDEATDAPIHIDFLAVAMDKLLTISVPLELEGNPIGVTRDKGVLSQIAYEVEIECLPGAIPHSVKVDVSKLGIGQAVHVGDLPEIDGVRFLTGKDHTIASVEAPRAEEVPAAAAEGATAEPEVLSKRKEEEEG